MSLRSKLLRAVFSPRIREIDYFRENPIEVQERMLKRLLHRAERSEFGWRYNFGRIKSAEQFDAMVGRFDYESFKPYIDQMLEGEKGVSYPGRVDMFAKSSGTTSDRSKYIPVTSDSIKRNHQKGMRDVATIYASNYPDSNVLSGKTLTLGGSCSVEGHALVGDLSALLIKDATFWGGWFRAPKIESALLGDFNQKFDAICKECVGQPITAFAGVPSWNLALMRRVLEYTGKSNIMEVWPMMELFVHGGMNFAPYRKAYEEIFPSSQMNYMETYNASEGFFAIADDPTREDMLLMLDYETYFEFRQGDTVVPLEGVKCGETYAVLISSNNGLWRYEIGDTVEFTSTKPYRIRFAGRTKQFINAFGEELIVDNADSALHVACEKTGAIVDEYTVAPMYMSLNQRGAHQWAVEFKREPEDRAQFAKIIDDHLRQINSDYDAKRQLTLDQIKLEVVEKGHFFRWLQARGKNKVPRMSNDRRVMDDILSFK